MEKQYYYLDISAKNCNVLGLLNGFPIYQLKAPSPVNFAMPINSVLIGRNNQLSIALTPASFDEELNLHDFDLMSMEAKGSIKIYREGEISAPENGQKILEFNLVGKPGTFTFDNNTIDFRRLFLEGPEIDEEQLIEEYALYLKSIFEQKDLVRIEEAFYPKLRAVAHSFFENFNGHVDDFRGFMKNIFLPLNPNLGFDQFDLKLVPWCDNRVWEIGLWNQKELLVTEPDEDGYEYGIKIFVAMVNGSLKVVR